MRYNHLTEFLDLRVGIIWLQSQVNMTSDEFLQALQSHAQSFAKAVATNEGDWIIKGFIDIYRRIYTISIDTKIVSKVLELLLFPMFVEFAKSKELQIELSPHQNFYPDITFIHEPSGHKFAVDIKSTYRIDDQRVNGMTLGAFTGYFRKRNSSKNILYPYEQYEGHYVLGVIYTKSDNAIDERTSFTLDDLQVIPSVIKDFKFFVQPKYKIASARPGSGNTKNIGSVVTINELINGQGSFAILGEEVYDDYWMFYLTRDMARAAEIERPYMDLKSYLEYKKRGIAILTAHETEIVHQEEIEEETEQSDESNE